MKDQEALPSVSIIMPAFNREEYIAASIQSVIAQTYQNWELLIIDDGSVDKTAKIAQRFVAIDRRIKYLFQPNQKMARARNNGIRQSSGEFIAFLDSDDLWIEQKLELQIHVILRANVDLVFSNGFIFTDDDIDDESTAFPIISGSFSAHEMFELLINANRIPTLSVLVRRNMLVDAGGFDERPNYYGVEDYDLWLTLAKHNCCFHGMKEQLVRYRVHSNGVSRDIAAMLKAELAVIEKHQRGNAIDRSRLKALRAQAARVRLDQYFTAARKKQLTAGWPHFCEAFKLSPITICHPRRLGAVIKNALQAVA
jgi:teichuronic acid biosynthesis glycosyltransferase TuaG